jgi:Zn-finger nucleic acid-binding protein
MQPHSLAGHHGRTVEIDLCEPCQAFWFDTHETLQLSPAATLSLFRVIGDRAARPFLRDGDVAKCPRCKARLRRTQDMQRSTRFEYLKCPHDHGQLISFFEFLKAKDFVKPLTTQQIAALRQHLHTVNCSNCGAPIDLTTGTACTHCGSPLSMLDLEHAERVVDQLRQADSANQSVDPLLPLNLARARADVEAAMQGLTHEGEWFGDLAATGLVGAGLRVVARWLQRDT